MIQRMSHIGNAKLNILGKVSPSLLFIHSRLQNKNRKIEYLVKTDVTTYILQKITGSP